MILHGYWRSGASYRVRIGLGLKGLAYQTAALDLRKGEQKAPAFLAINPQGMTPALQQGETVLTQSLAILEWLEETHPEPPLLPKDAQDRAQVRAGAGLRRASTLWRSWSRATVRVGVSAIVPDWRTAI